MRLWSILFVAHFFSISLHAASDRFTVFWNVPSERCYGKYDVSMPLSEYHIVHNSGFRFRGEQIALFYEYKSGRFPYFEGYNVSRPVNGGLPQNVDMASHLASLEEHIIESIPNVDFSGPAVIDVEEWRPMYHLNWGRKSIYKDESVRLVKERFPSISLKSARLVAEEEFNRATKKLLVATLRLARRLRPFAKWSMYGFPYCNYNAGQRGELMCSENYRSHNDRLLWLTDEFAALSPSIYLDLSTNNTAANYRYIYAVLSETKRIADQSTPSTPIIPYTKFEYNPYEHPERHEYYSKRDLCNSIKLSSDLGASGVLVWSTDRTMTKDRCHTIRITVANSFGPVADLVRRRVNRCSLEKCSGNGRCLLRRPADVCTFRMPMEDYDCQCDSGYYGSNCERRHYMIEEKKIMKMTTAIVPSQTSQPIDEYRIPIVTSSGLVQPAQELIPSQWTRPSIPPPTSLPPSLPYPPPLEAPINNIYPDKDDVPGLSIFARIL